MKKLVLGLAAIAVIAMVSAPAIAATEWNFGGMIRYATFWDQNKGTSNFPSYDLQGGGAAVKSDGVLNWGTQANTRLMVWMKSDSLEGFIELGYDFNENKVWTREYWGKYKMNDAMSITIGHQHQLYSSFISRQGGLDDLNMNGIGTSFRPPTPMIMFNFGGGGYLPGAPGGFSFALVKPETTLDYTYGDRAAVRPNRVNSFYYDEDTYIPQLQAAYQYYGDAFRIKVAGAYQWTKVKSAQFGRYNDAGTWLDRGSVGNKNIHTWLVSIDGDIAFGPLWLAANAAVGQNWGNAGLMMTEYGASHKSHPFGMTMDAASAQFKATPNGYQSYNLSMKNTTSWMVGVVAAYQLTEALRFEGGVGYRYDDNDAFKKSHKMLNAYVQAAYTVAPGFEIVPEIGYIDRGKDVWSGKDKGYLWYAGAQWNMYF